MNVLIACEESQRVCTAFREKGHNAFSCDIIPCSGGHPEWHIMQDVLPLLNGRCSFETMDGTRHEISERWDLIIAHPPCTYLTNAGACRLFKTSGKIDPERYRLGIEAKWFFYAFVNADCSRICIENPIPIRIFKLPKYTQIIQPYYFGEPFSKKTCLWLKGLPKLEPTNLLTDYTPFVSAGTKNGKGEKRKRFGYVHDQKERSKTFVGIAKAMADQWG